MKREYGSFSIEDGGRRAGHVMRVESIRKDGKYNVIHIFGSGKTIRKIYSEIQLQEQIAKFSWNHLLLIESALN